MHSSHPKSCREKILMDMDRIRKSFANFTGGEAGVGRVARDENTRQDTVGERNRKTDRNRDIQIEQYRGRENKQRGMLSGIESERKEVENTESAGKQRKIGNLSRNGSLETYIYFSKTPSLPPPSGAVHPGSLLEGPPRDGRPCCHGKTPEYCNAASTQ